MGPNECRLRAMVNPKSVAWDCDAKDKEAIQWALDRIKTLEDEAITRRQETIDTLRRGNVFRDLVREASEKLEYALA